MREAAKSYNRAPGQIHLKTYNQCLTSLAELTPDYEERLVKYSRFFRGSRGQNHLMVIYEQDFLPTLARTHKGKKQWRVDFDYGEAQKRKFNLKRVQVALNYAQIRFHILALNTNKFTQNRMKQIDNSGWLLEIFTQLAKETDGFKLSSTKPTSLVKQVGRLVTGTVTSEVINESMEEKNDKKKQ